MELPLGDGVGGGEEVMEAMQVSNIWRVSVCLFISEDAHKIIHWIRILHTAS